MAILYSQNTSGAGQGSIAVRRVGGGGLQEADIVCRG